MRKTESNAPRPAATPPEIKLKLVVQNLIKLKIFSTFIRTRDFGPQHVSDLPVVQNFSLRADDRAEDSQLGHHVDDLWRRRSARTNHVASRDRRGNSVHQDVSGALGLVHLLQLSGNVGTVNVVSAAFPLRLHDVPFRIRHQHLHSLVAAFVFVQRVQTGEDVLNELDLAIVGQESLQHSRHRQRLLDFLRPGQMVMNGRALDGG